MGIGILFWHNKRGTADRCALNRPQREEEKSQSAELSEDGGKSREKFISY